MQKTTKLLIATAVPLILSASSLFAQLNTTLDLPDGDNGYYRDPNSWGGEFTAYLSDPSDPALVNSIQNNYNNNAKNGSGIETFCVEINEEFTPGDTYQTSIGNAIVSSSGSTPLAAGVAYLYSQFAQGTLAGYNYLNSAGMPSRAYTADELQDAIWFLLGETTSAGDQYTTGSSTYRGGAYLYSFNATDEAANPFVALAESVCGTNGAFASDAGNNFGVQVLNLSSGGGVYNQDQLVYTCPVPEPATFAAGAMLLVPLGVNALRKLRRKS